MTATRDEDIELPDVWGDDTMKPEASTVLDLVKECRDRYRKQADAALTRALHNERAINGQQFDRLNATTWQLEENTAWATWVQKTPRNLMRNCALTWSSRILEDSPWVKCFPNAPGVSEGAAKICATILENVRQQIDFESLTFDAAQLVQPHSCVAFKTVWDPLIGPPSVGVPRFDENGFEVLDENGQVVRDHVGEPTGDVSVEVLSVFEYGTDGNEHIENARWVFFDRYVDLWDARSMLAAAGMDPSQVEEEEYDDPWGSKSTGVLITEIWWRPDSRFPRGLFASVVGKQFAVEAVPFPYEHGQIPLAVWKCGSRRGSPFGSTHVDDAIPIQEVINTTVAALTTQARELANIRMIAPTDVANAIVDAENNILKIDDPEKAKMLRYLEPPPRSQVLVDTLLDNTSALYTAWGLNEMLTGAESMKSGTSARSIAYLNRLDSMKSAGASRSYNKALLRVVRQILSLYRQYVQAPRLAAIAGEDTLQAVQEFRGADLWGVDVKIEPVSGKTQMRGQIADDAAQAIAQGNPDPALQSIAQTGVKDTAFARASRETVAAQIDMALRGEPQQADHDIDAQTAIAEIAKHLVQARSSPNLQLLLTLKQQYEQQLSRFLPQQPSGPQGPKPGQGP